MTTILVIPIRTRFPDISTQIIDPQSVGGKLSTGAVRG